MRLYHRWYRYQLLGISEIALPKYIHCNQSLKNRIEANTECRHCCDSKGFLTTIVTPNDAQTVKQLVGNSTILSKKSKLVDLVSKDPYNQYVFHTGISFDFKDYFWSYDDFWFFKRHGSMKFIISVNAGSIHRREDFTETF